MSKSSKNMDDTSAYVRSRPKLPGPPSGIVGTASSDNHDIRDIVGVITSLGNTDFVRKYSRKHRGSLTEVTGSTSPLSSSLSMSPSESISPVTGQRSRGITLTRMRSIKVKLEKVKEHQERMEAAQKNQSTSTNSEPDYSCATLTRRNVKSRLVSDGADMRSSTNTSRHSKSPNIPYDDRSSTDACDLEGYTRLARAMKDITDRKQSVERKEPCEDCRDRSSGNNQSGNNLDNSNNNSDKWEVSYYDSELPNKIEYDVKSTTRHDPLRKTSGKMLCSRYKYKLEKTRYAGDKINIEQGRTLYEPSDDDNLSATDSDRKSCNDCKFRDTSPTNSACESNVNKCTKHCKNISLNQNSRPEVVAKIDIAHFLTHPPFRDRASSKALRSVDSNGLRSFGECSGGHSGLNELKSNESVLSVDSNIGPSDTNDGPSYRDVVLDVTAGASVVENSERRNGKYYKYKSKSDPIGKKQECIETVDFSQSMQTHANSVPVLQSPTASNTHLEVQRSDGDKQKSMSNNVLDNNCLITPHIQELRSSQLMRSITSEESSEEYQPVSKVSHRKKNSQTNNEDSSDISEDMSRYDLTGSPVLSSTAPSSPRSGLWNDNMINYTSDSILLQIICSKFYLLECL